MTQFKPELIKKILAGEKTQTRRPQKPGDVLFGTIIHGNPNLALYQVYRNGRLLWETGKTYAICPGRGKPQVARFKLLCIRQEDVRQINLTDTIAEGFSYKDDFLKAWCGFYDPSMVERLWQCEYVPERPAHCPIFLYRQPDELYQAWALTFELEE